MKKLKEDIVQYAKNNGIDKIGFASVDPFTELKQRLIEREKLNYASGFEKGSGVERTEPKRLMNGAKSSSRIALAYTSRIPNAQSSTREKSRGVYCRAR